MTHEQRKAYEDKIDNLVKAKSQADCNIKEVEIELSGYYKELELIKEKYDYETRSGKLSNYKLAYNDAHTKMISVKLQYICHLINDVINSIIFRSEETAMDWITNSFNIKYDDEYDKTFYDLYHEIIDCDDFDDCDWYYDKKSSTYSISHTWYCRYEEDGTVCISIHEDIVNNIYSFESKLKMAIQLLETQRNKVAQELEEETKEIRYQMYLKLQQEFGG